MKQNPLQVRCGAKAATSLFSTLFICREQAFSSTGLCAPTTTRWARNLNSRPPFYCSSLKPLFSSPPAVSVWARGDVEGDVSKRHPPCRKGSVIAFGWDTALRV